MSYCFKKLVLLSPVGGVTPVFRAERASYGWDCTLTFNEKFDRVIIYDGSVTATLTESRGNIDVNAEKGLAVAVVAGDEILSFGTSGLNVTRESFKNRFLDAYDDEAIAETNYFEGLYEQKNEDADPDDGPEKGKADKIGDGDAQYDDARIGASKKSGFKNASPEAIGDTKSAYAAQARYCERLASNIAVLMHDGTPYPPLSSVVPHSRWVTVNDGESEYYFGLQGSPDYICYAITGQRGEPPKGFEDAFFMPETYFNESEKGYYVTFQSAEDGKAVLRTP